MDPLGQATLRRFEHLQKPRRLHIQFQGFRVRARARVRVRVRARVRAGVRVSARARVRVRFAFFSLGSGFTEY